MSDFGSDVSNNGVGIMMKLLDALLKLIEKIFNEFTRRMSAEYKLKKAEYKIRKGELKEQKNRKKIEGKSGLVNHKILQKSGVPLAVRGIEMDDNGFKELAERCKREGIVISGVEDATKSTSDDKKFFVIQCRQSDLERFNKLVVLMTDEKKIDLINEEVEKIKGNTQELKEELSVLKDKGELNPEDIKRINVIEREIKENNLVIKGLNEKIQDIRLKHSEELYQEQAKAVVEKAVYGKTVSGVTLDEALNRWTSNKLDKDITCYVVDAKNPNNYIVCKAANDTYKDETYIKTNYEVYNGGKHVYATHDGRFDNRPKGYWENEKAAMKEAGQFSDFVIKFYSLKELEAYREKYEMQNETELAPLNLGKEGRDYDSMIKTLEDKLNESGATYKDGKAIDKDSKEPVTTNENMTDEQKANIAEAAVIAKQIQHYQEMKQIETEVALARSSVLLTHEGTNEHIIAQEAFNSIEDKYNQALNKESELMEERKEVNALQAKNEINKEPVIDKEQGVEKPDDRREEKVTEIDKDKMSMDEYTGQINTNKQTNGVKGNDVKDRDVTKDKVIQTSKGDR